MSEHCTPERFLNDVAGHTIKVLHEHGLNRHLRFDNDGSSVYHFNITTWPGYLAISGDMGCYVFSRINDMFDFFSSNDGLKINPQYWAEKVVSQSKYGEGVKAFDASEYAASVEKQFTEYFEVETLADLSDDLKELWGEVRDELCGSDIYECVEAARRFHNADHPNLMAEILSSANMESYTFHYIWCLYAIVWGIQKYREQVRA